MLYPVTLESLFYRVVVELSAVICYDALGRSKPCDDVLLDE